MAELRRNLNGSLALALGCMRCTVLEIKSRIAMAKEAFKKNTLFPKILRLNLRKKLVKYRIRSIAWHGSETWTRRKVDRNTWKILKCGAGEQWRRSIGPIM